MLLTQIALGIFLVQTATVSQPHDGAPAPAPIHEGSSALEVAPQAQISAPMAQPEMTAPEAPAALGGPRALSYQEVPLIPLYPPARPMPAAPDAEEWTPPSPPAESWAGSSPWRPLTTVHFAEAKDGTPYAVQSWRTREICTAPCALQVPPARNRFVFQTSERTFARKFNLAGPDQTLRLERAGHGGMVLGGALLLSAGIALDLGFLLSSASVFSDFEGTKREKYGRWALAAGVSSMITGALLTSGIILIVKGKPKVSRTFTARDGQPNASASSALDTLEFAVTPLREGISAGAGLRF